jgi:hypothetical protein
MELGCIWKQKLRNNTVNIVGKANIENSVLVGYKPLTLKGEQYRKTSLRVKTP